MNEWDGNWIFNRARWVVCRQYCNDPLLLLSREEWAAFNKKARANGQATLIEVGPAKSFKDQI